MDVPTEVQRIEARMKAAGYPVAELLRRANVAASQWQRWKQGDQTPLVSTWTKISDAARELAPEEAAA